VDEHVEHRALDRIRVHPLAHREVALRIEVDDEDTASELVERDAEVQRRRRLRDTALLVREGNDVRHHVLFHEPSRRGLGGRHGMETRGRVLGLDRLRVDNLLPRLGPRQKP
jgi:hypothetical protein